MGDPDKHDDPSGVAEVEPVERRPSWFMRARIPVWVALPVLIVAVLFAVFLSYPQRSVSSAVEGTFRGTDNVEITYCLSNEAARNPERWKAEERFKRELESLGVRNVSLRFVSPCPDRVAPPTTPAPTEART